MKYTVSININLSLEDLAALAECGYSPPPLWQRGRLQRIHAKPTQRDIKEFVKDAIKEKLRGAYVSSGAGRKEFLERWRHEED